MISKGCLYYVVRFNNLEYKIPPLESVPVVRDFLNETYFNSSRMRNRIRDTLVPDTKHISIPPYWKALAEFQEIKF